MSAAVGGILYRRVRLDITRLRVALVRRVLALRPGCANSEKSDARPRALLVRRVAAVLVAQVVLAVVGRRWGSAQQCRQ